MSLYRSCTITRAVQLFNDVHTIEFQTAQDGLPDQRGGGPAMQKSHSCDGIDLHVAFLHVVGYLLHASISPIAASHVCIQ